MAAIKGTFYRSKAFRQITRPGAARFVIGGKQGPQGPAGAGGGDVVGPSSATDKTIPRFDTATGKLIQGSGVTIDDSNNVNIPGNLSVNGNTVIGNASGDSLTWNVGTWTLAANYIGTRDYGAASAGTNIARFDKTTFSGDAGGTTDIRSRIQRVTASGANDIAQVVVDQYQIEIQTTAGTTTQVNANQGYIRLGLAGSITGGAITSARWMWGHIANEGNSNIESASVYHAGDTDLADGTGQIGTNFGFTSGNVGHASRVTGEATGFAAADITGGAPLTAGFRSAVSLGTGKYAFVANGGAGIGYGTGAGGAVTQSTSKATGVTLDRICGQITMNNAALAAGAEVQFILTNSAIAAGDILHVNHVSGGTLGSYVASCAYTTGGSAAIRVKNTSVGSLSQAVVLGFAIFKAVAA